MRGRFITFEGLDGSGKSTHLRHAARWLSDQGVEVVVTHEPGGTDLGTAVRGLFLDPAHGSMDGRTELLLISAARRHHVTEVVEPSLVRGAWVLCDRFHDSTLAYQGSGRGVDLEEIRVANRLATSGLVPDLTILFDLPAEAARRRGQSPRRRSRQEVDRLDAEELAFYQRVRDGFLRLAEEEPARFRKVDSSGPKAGTRAAVINAVRTFLGTAR